EVMQPRIDAINRVLRGQINGVRVVRAFVREPAEAARFDAANADLTATAVQVGKLQAVMFPVVLLVANASRSGVLWSGGPRVADGDMQIGSMLAFLSYLITILLAILIVTFFSTQIPRAMVCARRIAEVLDTVSSVAPPRAPVVPSGVPGR